MTGYLLDTNIISELTRDDPNPQVVAFLSNQQDMWLSVVLIHEVGYGLRLLPQGQRRSRLSEMQSSILERYEDRILPLDRAAAECSAELGAQVRRAGRTVDLGDVLIAGIAKAHDLTVVTRNIDHFDALDIEVVNPWEASAP